MRSSLGKGAGVRSSNEARDNLPFQDNSCPSATRRAAAMTGKQPRPVVGGRSHHPFVVLGLAMQR